MRVGACGNLFDLEAIRELKKKGDPIYPWQEKKFKTKLSDWNKKD